MDALCKDREGVRHDDDMEFASGADVIRGQRCLAAGCGRLVIASKASCGKIGGIPCSFMLVCWDAQPL